MRRRYAKGEFEPFLRETTFGGARVTLRCGGILVSGITITAAAPPLSLEAVSMVFADGTYRWVDMPQDWRDWDDARLFTTLPLCRMQSDDA